jgi:hypothetical protein
VRPSLTRNCGATARTNAERASGDPGQMHTPRMLPGPTSGKSGQAWTGTPVIRCSGTPGRAQHRLAAESGDGDGPMMWANRSTNGSTSSGSRNNPPSPRRHVDRQGPPPGTGTAPQRTRSTQAPAPHGATYLRQGSGRGRRDPQRDAAVDSGHARNRAGDSPRDGTGPVRDHPAQAGLMRAPLDRRPTAIQDRRQGKPGAGKGYRPRPRAMISFWISVVPPKIDCTRLSVQARPTGYSRM